MIIRIFSQEFFDSYDFFKNRAITTNRFTQVDLFKWLEPLEGQNTVSKQVLGASYEGRPIPLYAFGEGDINVMLWSQMHGDEPTATMALTDVLNFLVTNTDHSVTKMIKDKLQLLIIPMLNPDGTERFTRQTAQLIDINRDALALTTPESRILKNVQCKYKPQYAFNLHDQDPRLTVGMTNRITAVALLAPPIDEFRTDNEVQRRAKKMASLLTYILDGFIPGYVAKWDNTFEPRAFGDNIQKWGTSTVLIESGGWHGDPQKFFIRKLNCICLLTALYAIASGEVDKFEIDAYENLPFNSNRGYDFIIRNTTYRSAEGDDSSRVDIGINVDRSIVTSSDIQKNDAMIMEIGDLATFTALEKEIDANGAELLDKIKLGNRLAIDEIERLLKKK